MNFTIYSVSADLTLLRAILNGVAMICTQTQLIWGFAIMVALWNILRAVVGATVNSGGNGAASLATGGFNVLLPLIFAMILTAPGLKSSVNLQSTINGTIGSVDNVPVAISILPATASVLSQELGAVVGTAFQTTGTDYASISSTGNGFINPLKVLLTSRTAMMRMGSLDSQVRSLISACINTDAGSDFAKIIDKVTYAGNTAGAQTNEALEIKGAKKTAIGALLYQAKLNSTGFVNDLDPTSQTIMSCSAAADYVQNNINTSLGSDEFKRAVQGSVNGMDTPNPNADFSFDHVAQQYSALRTAQKTLSQLVDGATQTNTEIINLLFNEMITSNLNCLKADSTSKTVCQAANIQALEIERNNIQRAANEVSMLKYAGAFANYITALVIGLGPVIIMFMMFSGVGATRSMFAAAHVIVWPILVLNVGAELVNGMICIQVASFLDSIAQSGYITQSNAIEAYKQFGIQIGTASHIMASLPVLLSMIFALGASSAMVSVAQGMAPQGADVGTAMAPRAMNAAPLINSTSMASARQGDGFSVYSETGSLAAANSMLRTGNVATDLNRANTFANQRQKVIQQGQTLTENFQKKDAQSLANEYGITKEQAQNIQKAYRENLGRDVVTAEGTAGQTQVANQGSAQLNAGAGIGKGVFAAGAKGTLNASDTTTLSTSGSKDTRVTDARALENAITQTRTQNERNGVRQENSQGLEKLQTVARNYAETLSDTKSITETSAQSTSLRNELVAASTQLTEEAFGQSVLTNTDMQAFQMGAARKLESDPAAQKYMDQARKMAKADSVSNIRMSPMASDALIRSHAAALMASDSTASPAIQQAGVNYLTQQGLAMTGQAAKFTAPVMLDKPDINDGKPITNNTGVNANKLIAEVDKGLPVPARMQKLGINDKLVWEKLSKIDPNLPGAEQKIREATEKTEGANSDRILKELQDRFKVGAPNYDSFDAMGNPTQNK